MSALLQPGSHNWKLLIECAQLISLLEKEIDNLPEYVLCQRQVSCSLSSNVWPRLKANEKNRLPSHGRQTTTLINLPPMQNNQALNSQTELAGMESAGIIKPMSTELYCQ